MELKVGGYVEVYEAILMDGIIKNRWRLAQITGVDKGRFSVRYFREFGNVIETWISGDSRGRMWRYAAEKI